MKYNIKCNKNEIYSPTPAAAGTTGLQDIARLTLAALRNEACHRRTLTLAGPTTYTTKEVIEMCERLSDSTAKVTSVPTWLLKATRGLLKGADWAKDAADRLVGSWEGLWAHARQYAFATRGTAS